MLAPILQWTIVLITLASLLAALTYSFKYRRSTDARLRGLFAARMNISMGLMLIAMAFLQMVIFSGSSITVIVEALFLLIGLFNLVSGIRNHAYFRRQAS